MMSNCWVYLMPTQGASAWCFICIWVPHVNVDLPDHFSYPCECIRKCHLRLSTGFGEINVQRKQQNLLQIFCCREAATHSFSCCGVSSGFFPQAFRIFRDAGNCSTVLWRCLTEFCFMNLIWYIFFPVTNGHTSQGNCHHATFIWPIVP